MPGAPSWPSSIIIAVLTGILGLFAAGLIANACVSWYRISGFEGKAGYFVAFTALQDWRDVEALAALDTPASRLALKTALESPDHQVRAAVTRCAPGLIGPADRIASMVQALERADFYGGLTQTLDQVEAFHPPEVIDALFRGVLARDSEVSVHFAAMLMFLHGKAAEAFDWEQRPFYLTFHTAERSAREAAFRQLCEKIGVDGSRYL